MFKNRFISTLLVLIILLGLTSCLGDNANARISIYRLEMDGNALKALNSYKELYKGIPVDEKVFSMNEMGKYMEKISAELAAGKGPDIVLIPAGMNKYLLSKLITNDAFADFNELIDQNGEFMLSDYNEKVLQCGVNGGKRYLIPISYCVPALFTTNEALEKNSIKSSGSAVTFEELRNAVTNKLLKSKYLFSKFDFSSFVKNSEVGYFDYQNLKLKIDTDKVKELLTAYKDSQLSNSVYPEEIKANEFDLLKDGKVVMINEYIRNLNKVFDNYNGLDMQQTPAVFSIPSSTGENTIISEPMGFVGINANSKNKKKAFDFVKVLLSKEIQGDPSMINIPVNKEAYQKMKNTAAANYKGESINNIISLVDKVGGCEIPDYDINKISVNASINYVQNLKTLDEALDYLEVKIEEYIEDTKLPVLEEEAEGEKAGVAALKVYHCGWPGDAKVKNAIYKFNETYKDIVINETAFSSTEYANKLTAELLAGEGPDIIVGKTFYFPSIRKMASSGVFYDLSELITDDKDFNISNFNKNIMDMGVFDGKRCFLPYSYELYGFIAMDSMLKKHGVKIEGSDWSWEKFAEIAKDFRKNNPGIYLADANLLFSTIIESCGFPFIDYERKVSKFNSSEFIKLLKLYKEIYPSICPGDLQRRFNKIEDYYTNGVCDLYLDFTFSSPGEIYSINKNMKKQFGQGVTVYQLPTFSGKKGIFATPMDIVGINSKCKYKKEAFNFIKMLLSKEFQGRLDNNGNMNVNLYTTTNLDAYKADMDYYLGGLKVDGKEPMPKALADQVNSMVRSVEKSQLNDREIYKIVDVETVDYLKNKRSAEATANIINDKVMVYLNE